MLVRVVAFVFLCGVVPTAAVAQVTNPLTPEHLIPAAPDIPRTKLSKWKADAGRATQTLATEQGLLRGYLYAGKDPAAPTILFFNSNAQTLESNDTFYRKLAELGPSVVAYDYAGYGVSGGSADVLVFREDALALYDQTLAQTPSHKVIVYGYALGTAMATYVASKRAVAGMILAAPMSGALEQMKYEAEQRQVSPTSLQLLRVGPYLTTTLDEVGMIKQSTAPLLVIHGTADKTIAYGEGREVFTASPSTKKYFVKIEGADHPGLPAQPGAFQSLKLFVPVVEKAATS